MKKVLLFISVHFLCLYIYSNVEDIKLNDIICVKEKETGYLYYPVRFEENTFDVTVSYNTDYAKEIIIENEKIISGNKYSFLEIDKKKEYELKIIDSNNNITITKLIIVGMPIVLIDTNMASIIAEERIQCDLSVLDPYGRINGTNFNFKHKAGIKIRGASSASAPKKSYSFEFQDVNEEEVDVSLLGLRSDGDWILDAMYIDKARMRNRLCTDIWNSFNNVPHHLQEPEAINGTRGYFVEVFLNNSYNGLYCLTERIDRKQLKIKKDKNDGGIIFKGKHWTSAMSLWGYDKEESLDDLLWCGWEFEYPGETEFTKWNLLMDLIDISSLSYNPDHTYFAENIEQYIDLDNVIDYIIFLNSVYAQDNNMKNTYLSIYNLKNDRRFFITPWDLDATFGRAYEGSLLEKYGFTDNLTFSNSLFRRLFDHNPCNFKARLKSRWEDLKKNHLSVKVISDRIDVYRDIQHYSGASKREQEKWPGFLSDIYSETQFMKDWYAENYVIIDKYISDLNVGNGSLQINKELPVVYVDGTSLIVKWSSVENFEISIYNMLGKEVSKKDFKNIETAKVTINNSGLYFIKIFKSKRVYLTEKIVIQ